MAIEIKELVVRFSIDKQDENRSVERSTNINAKTLQDIVRQCSQEVLEKLAKETER